MMLNGTILSLAYQENDPVEGPYITLYQKRGIIKNTVKTLMKAYKTRKVRYAKEILLSGATFVKTEVKNRQTTKWYSKNGGKERAEKDFNALGAKNIHEVEYSVPWRRIRRGEIGNSVVQFGSSYDHLSFSYITIGEKADGSTVTTIIYK